MISIIIPVYNSRKWLARCIDSVLAQTCKKWELLLIDDGSTDGSERICDFYSEQDNRVRVVHKKNGGVSSARNVGIKNATYPWITFMDSDDYIEPDAIHHYIETINTHKSHLFNFRYYFNYDANNVEFIKGHINGMVTTDTADGKLMYEICQTLWHVWDNIYSKAIIDQYSLQFNENTKLGEDQLFNLYYLQHCKEVYFSDKGFYQYYWAHNPQSLTFCKQSPKERASYAIEKYKIYKILNVDHKKAKKIYKADIMYSCAIAIKQKKIKNIAPILVKGNNFKNNLWFTRNQFLYCFFSLIYKIRLVFSNR